MPFDAKMSKKMHQNCLYVIFFQLQNIFHKKNSNCCHTFHVVQLNSNNIRQSPTAKFVWALTKMCISIFSPLGYRVKVLNLTTQRM